MLGDSSSTGLGSSSGGDAAAAAAVGGGEDFLTGTDRSFGGNRWPRQETLALLKIRSDMDVAFRDASVKGPLWDEVSRKLAELGYHRSAKKCKEKFENVFKYHKRIKEGRTGKPDGKTYRFFDQLEALENQLFSTTTSSPPPPPPATAAAQPKAQAQALAMQAVAVVTTTTAAMANTNSNPLLPQNSTVPSISTTTIPSQATIMNLALQSSFQAAPTNPTVLPVPPQPLAAVPLATTATNPTFSSAAAAAELRSISADLASNSMTTSSMSSDEEMGEEESGGGGRRKRKRKWKDFFERLMKEVIQRQEEQQKKFLEAVEKREHERMVREEAWRMQEMSRINREREILAQERSIAAVKDAAVMSFLQKISEQQNQNPEAAAAAAAAANINIPQPTPIIQPVQSTPPPPQPQPSTAAAAAAPPPLPPRAVQPVIQNIENVLKSGHNTNNNNNGSNSNSNNNNNNTNNNFMAGSASSSRWPKAEVLTLIKLRTNLDAKYQENGPKGPLWEEISAAMRKLGYNRNAKRCKEKWENINKYFKKVKESNKKRPEDSKTCPYFHQLDALYREKNKYFDPAAVGQFAKPENSVPLMVQPEQQWPPAAVAPPSGDRSRAVEMERLDQMDHDEDEEEDEEEDEDDDEEDEEGGNNYELVANKPASTVNAAE
ncbi:TFIIB transcription factor [Parasponia andersonii]|uniref:TFIIB transcription factor n=1 Tax=Parasponia andersonii TaxID=3476 RepID=A0A2P5DSF6_PARAD|nr:TFIIB transcription factor [Parasponia andersonii]